jgi:hypothetical protein
MSCGPDDLWELCRKFIDDNKITCEETCFQSDRVIENSLDLVYQICEIVGYAEREEDDD